MITESEKRLTAILQGLKGDMTESEKRTTKLSEESENRTSHRWEASGSFPSFGQT
jgi:hypothetical protein